MARSNKQFVLFSVTPPAVDDKGHECAIVLAAMTPAQKAGLDCSFISSTFSVVRKKGRPGMKGHTQKLMRRRAKQQSFTTSRYLPKEYGFCLMQIRLVEGVLSERKNSDGGVYYSVFHVMKRNNLS
jgi:hypothetical protein